MKRNHFLLLLLLAGFLSCKRENATTILGKVPGYIPLYSNAADLYLIQNKPPREVKKAGKIYVKGNYIFQNEIGQGIHIINNTNPSTAARTGFISIVGSEEISIKGNYLYSNNFSDLVVIDITDLSHVKEVSRVRNMFYNAGFQAAPPAGGSYFECPDKSKGIITGWVLDSVSNPQCKN